MHLHVDTFATPSDFFDAWEDQHFDLLLTDLKMPQMDGVEVLKKVRSENEDIPVILMTAHATVLHATSPNQ